jgi:hypothetical protein
VCIGSIDAEARAEGVTPPANAPAPCPPSPPRGFFTPLASWPRNLSCKWDLSAVS